MEMEVIFEIVQVRFYANNKISQQWVKFPTKVCRCISFVTPQETSCFGTKIPKNVHFVIENSILIAVRTGLKC